MKQSNDYAKSFLQPDAKELRAKLEKQIRAGEMLPNDVFNSRTQFLKFVRLVEADKIN